jgi:hypothetical protein
MLRADPIAIFCGLPPLGTAGPTCVANEIDKTNAHRNCAKRVGQRRPRRAADQDECQQEMREAGLCVKSSSVVVAVVVHRPMRRPQEDVPVSLSPLRVRYARWFDLNLRLYEGRNSFDMNVFLPCLPSFLPSFLPSLYQSKIQLDRFNRSCHCQTRSTE